MCLVFCLFLCQVRGLGVMVSLFCGSSVLRSVMPRMRSARILVTCAVLSVLGCVVRSGEFGLSIRFCARYWREVYAGVFLSLGLSLMFGSAVLWRMGFAGGFGSAFCV